MDIREKSKLMHKKREDFIVHHLNPHEKEMQDFISEVVAEFNIKTKEDWSIYEHLIPDCARKLIMYLHYQKI